MTDLVWDDRLISRERALRLAGDWPTYVGIDYADLEQYEAEGSEQKQPGQWQLNLRCGRCHQNCALLGTLDVQPGATLIGSVNYVAFSPTTDLSAVLRHMVMAHDVSLSGAEAHPE